MDTRDRESYRDGVTTSPDPATGQQHDQGAPGGSQSSQHDPTAQPPAQVPQASSGGPGEQQEPGGGSGAYPPNPASQPSPYPYGPYQPNQPAASGQQPGPGQPYPYGGQYYPYNPYGTTLPTTGSFPGVGAPNAPVQRPGHLIAALILLLFSALPPLLGGVALVAAPFDASQVPADLQEALRQQGVPVEQLFEVLRLGGYLTIAASLLFVVLALLAFLGRNAARITLTVLTCLFTVVLLLGLMASVSSPASAIVPLVVLIAMVAGTGLLYSPAAANYYASRRR